jgi:hypothetical protein
LVEQGGDEVPVCDWVGGSEDVGGLEFEEGLSGPAGVFEQRRTDGGGPCEGAAIDGARAAECLSEAANPIELAGGFGDHGRSGRVGFDEVASFEEDVGEKLV